MNSFESLTPLQRVGSALCAALLAATCCISPYSAARAYAVVPLAVPAVGYALCAIMAACGIAVTVNSTSAKTLASDFKLYTDDLTALSNSVNKLMSSFADAAKASGQGVEYTPAAITSDDINKCAQILTDAANAGTLELSKISPYASATTLSVIPFILQAYFNYSRSTASVSGFTPSTGWTSSVYPYDSSYVTFNSSYTYTTSAGGKVSESFSILTPGSDAQTLFGEPFYYAAGDSVLVPVYYSVISDIMYYVAIDYIEYQDNYSGDLQSLLSDIYMYAPDYGAGYPTSFRYTFTEDNEYLPLISRSLSTGLTKPVSLGLGASSSQDGFFSPYIDAVFSLSGQAGIPFWNAASLTDNPDVNLGRDYWSDANRAVQGGIVAGSGVGALVGSGSVASGGLVINRGRLGIPTDWGGVDSWADALDKTGAAVGDGVYSPSFPTTTTVTGAKVGTATGEVAGTLTGELETITQPGNPTGTISISAPATSSTNPLSYDFAGSSVSFLDKFPFCIPNDVRRVVNAMTANREAPRFTWPIWTPNGDYDLTVDLSDYSSLAAVLRDMFSLFVIFGSIYLSIRFVALLRNATNK